MFTSLCCGGNYSWHNLNVYFVWSSKYDNSLELYEQTGTHTLITLELLKCKKKLCINNIRVFVKLCKATQIAVQCKISISRQAKRRSTKNNIRALSNANFLYIYLYVFRFAQLSQIPNPIFYPILYPFTPGALQQFCQCHLLCKFLFFQAFWLPLDTRVGYTAHDGRARG